MSSCQRCSGTYNGPAAFLLTCRGCSKTWHHRCLMPPMGDQDLIHLIRATNERDTANDLSSWMCRRCKRLASETPSTVSSREQTASSESREDSKTLTSNSTSPPITDSASTATGSITSTADIYVKQEPSSTVNALHVNHQERNKSSDRQESTRAAPVNRTLVTKRTKSSAANQPHVQPQPGPSRPREADMPMAGITTQPTPQEKQVSPQRPSPQTQSYPVKAARKLGSTTSTTSSEDDVEMQVDTHSLSDSTLRATSHASPAPSSIGSESVAGVPPPAHAISVTNEQGQEARPAVGVAVQPQSNQVPAEEVDDDPEDLYGPPVERRIIRILPSLAEELREQQRRVAAEKEKRRAPLAPDWILAKHVNDPLWKEVRATEGRNRRKATARRLGENGLNVDELMDCFTVQNWVREYKKRT